VTQRPSSGYRNVLVWVGCIELAERACELASAIAHPSLPVTLGVPAGAGARVGLEKVVRVLVEREADVRVVPLDDRGSITLARLAREGSHDLVIHADRDGATTPTRERLETLCACPVWTVRGPQRRPEDAAGPQAA